MRVTRTAHFLEWQDWAEVILAEPYKVVDGALHIPDRPGLGLDWDEGAVSRYQVVWKKKQAGFWMIDTLVQVQKLQYEE